MATSENAMNSEGQEEPVLTIVCRLALAAEVCRPTSNAKGGRRDTRNLSFQLASCGKARGIDEPTAQVGTLAATAAHWSCA